MKRQTWRVVTLECGTKVLAPSCYDSAKLLERTEAGTDLDFTPNKGRSRPQLKLYFALLSKCVEATDGLPYPTKSRAHKSMLMALGYVELVWDVIAQDFVPVPMSVAMHEMPQDEFQIYFDRAQRLVFEQWLGSREVGEAQLAEINAMFDRMDNIDWSKRRLQGSRRLLDG